MQARAKPRIAFNDTLQATVGQLVERAVATPEGRERSRLLRWLLAAGVLFLAWRFAKGLKSLFWAALGIGMAFYWSGGWLLLR